MNIDKKTLRLYAVTDRTWLDGRTLYDDVAETLKGGVTLLQLREKNMSTDDFINSAKEIKSLCEKYTVPLIINDNVDVAKAVNAEYGVHIGQNDMPTHEARSFWGKKQNNRRHRHCNCRKSKHKKPKKTVLTILAAVQYSVQQQKVTQRKWICRL